MINNMTDGRPTVRRTGLADENPQIQRNIVRKMVGIAGLLAYQPDANKTFYLYHIDGSHRTLNIAQYDEK